MVIGPWAIGGIWLGYGQVGREASSCLKCRKLKKIEKIQLKISQQVLLAIASVWVTGQVLGTR